MTNLFVRLGIAALVGLATTASATSADVELTGRVRLYVSGFQLGVHIDVKNDSNHRVAFGPNVYVRIKDQNGNLITEQTNRKLYQYFGGTATAANTLNPKQLGYIQLNVAKNANLFVGQTVKIKISGEGASNFGSDSKNGSVCRKGTLGCP